MVTVSSFSKNITLLLMQSGKNSFIPANTSYTVD